MPSGITAPIAEGKDITAAEFIMRCARQFGGLAHMRDEDMDAPITPRKASTERYDESIQQAEERLKHLQAMSLEQVEAEVRESYEYELTRYNKSVEEKNKVRARYEAVLEKVKLWAPPTAEHEAIKAFAIKQIVDSIDWDCKIYEPPIKQVAQEYLDSSIEGAEKSILFYTKLKAEEIERIEEANKWVAELVESILAFHTKSLEEPKSILAFHTKSLEEPKQ